ncbi:hypothetical protein PHLGIDRAFT_181726 [Phlebiopsis gigantea 11061_1 CR5-6]|uniref:Uncharacterized protein n=1 Tax=Phlebiopsis gigantea (strain 11061_1 CR5-6) TaxID=745531 RepID=A0A0C3NIL9_PHLG1|nr:hypothetical protein PHLGIDRAFT_181726 [Phlebiopsis gigantea 11061_1 CR5-6]
MNRHGHRQGGRAGASRAGKYSGIQDIKVVTRLRIVLTDSSPHLCQYSLRGEGQGDETQVHPTTPAVSRCIIRPTPRILLRRRERGPTEALAVTTVQPSSPSVTSPTSKDHEPRASAVSAPDANADIASTDWPLPCADMTEIAGGRWGPLPHSRHPAVAG